jgi:glycerol-3-phosphate acyltransferase PlsX
MSLNGAEQGRLVRVAVDTMGGDFAPVETVKGAVQALRSVNAELLLVGDPDPVKVELAKYDVAGLPISIVPSDGKIGDDEHPLQAMRQKPRASVVVATHLVKEGQADVMVSMGSTGASMASAVLTLGLMEGLERPCLGGPFLGLAPNTVLVDIGSNLDCRPGLLLSFAVLGAAFAHTYMGVENPRIGLLSVGAEAAKGNRQVQESYQLFRDSHLNFVGNVEGMDFFTGKADVIICDGFVGNILVKFTEGMGGALGDFVRERLAGSVDPAVVDTLAGDLWETTNRPRTVGGGPLFGINAPVILGHGSCRANGIEGAVSTAVRYVNVGLLDIMRQELAIINNSGAGASASSGVGKAADAAN